MDNLDDSLQARFYSHLQKKPDSRALAFYDRRGGFDWITYEQLHERASGLASQLQDRGFRSGDVCLLVLPSGEFCTTLLVAVLILGGVPLLIAPPTLQSNSAYSSLARVLEHVISVAKPRIVICPEAMADMRAELDSKGQGTHFVFGETALSAMSVKTNSLATPLENDIAAMQLTSGTTGFPRICVWRQKGVLAALDGMANAMKLNNEDVCLNWTPLYHDMGLVNNFFVCLANGIPLVMQSPLDFVKKPAIWLRALSETGATLTWSPNFGFALAAQRVRDNEIDGVSLSDVRAFWNAAERIHHNTMVDFFHRFKPYGLRFEALKTNFGCAENVGGATFSDPDGPYVVERISASTMQNEGVAQITDDKGDASPTVTVVSAGRPYSGLEIEILSEDGDFLPEGHVGEIGLRTPSRMSGFLEDAAETDRALYGDLLRTGDLGYKRNGELFWVGRLRERISIRGKKLDPSDFEPILLQVDGLRHGTFAAFGVDDDLQGTQRIVIVCEVRDSTLREPKDIVKEIQTRTVHQLGMSISDVILVRTGTLTKTSSGKRRHRYFRELYLKGGLNDYEWRMDSVTVS